MRLFRQSQAGRLERRSERSLGGPGPTPAPFLDIRAQTLAASAVGDLDEMFAHMEKKAPLKRNIDADEVGKTAVYLLSDLSSGVTGENVYVDAGFNTVGL